MTVLVTPLLHLQNAPSNRLCNLHMRLHHLRASDILYSSRMPEKLRHLRAPDILCNLCMPETIRQLRASDILYSSRMPEKLRHLRAPDILCNSRMPETPRQPRASDILYSSHMPDMPRHLRMPDIPCNSRMSNMLRRQHRAADHYNGTSSELVRLRATCLTPPTGSDHRQPRCTLHAISFSAASLCAIGYASAINKRTSMVQHHSEVRSCFHVL
ncbi:hypothetical protein Hdeb2414_s0005g00169491 [Helianthus debilis subsp. tardiflorus]